MQEMNEHANMCMHTPRTTKSIQCLLVSQCTRQQTALHFCGNTNKQSMSRMVLVPDTWVFMKTRRWVWSLFWLLFVRPFHYALVLGVPNESPCTQLKSSKVSIQKAKWCNKLWFLFNLSIWNSTFIFKKEMRCLNKMIGKTCINYKNRKRWQQNWFKPVWTSNVVLVPIWSNHCFQKTGFNAFSWIQNWFWWVINWVVS